MNARTFSTDHRAVSNTLGYAITLALIIGAVILILASGVGSVDEIRETSEANNALRAMDILTNNIEDVYRWGAPSRATEIKLSDAKLSFDQGTPTDIRVTVQNPNTGVETNYSTSINDFTYETRSGTRGVYDAGLLYRQDPAQGAQPLVAESPPFVFTENRTGLTVLETRGSGSIGGTTTTLVIVERQASSLVHQETTLPPESPLDVTVSINSSAEKATAWNTYLQSQGLTAVDSDPTDGTVTYTHTTQRVYLRAITLRFSLNK